MFQGRSRDSGRTVARRTRVSSLDRSDRPASLAVASGEGRWMIFRRHPGHPGIRPRINPPATTRTTASSRPLRDGRPVSGTFETCRRPWRCLLAGEDRKLSIEAQDGAFDQADISDAVLRAAMPGMRKIKSPRPATKCHKQVHGVWLPAFADDGGLFHPTQELVGLRQAVGETAGVGAVAAPVRQFLPAHGLFATGGVFPGQAGLGIEGGDVG
jgi:hypothetical protein